VLDEGLNRCNKLEGDVVPIPTLPLEGKVFWAKENAVGIRAKLNNKDFIIIQNDFG
jgi:hypothetical protein